MVYTVTLNPALDHAVYVSHLETGAVNRMNREMFEVGGKGVNVSIVLNELSVKSKALGFIAGFTGDEIERRLSEKGIASDFVKLKDGISRVNIKFKNFTENGVTETEINSDGPDISDEALAELFVKLSAIEDGDILVLAGSVPHTLPKNIYEQILEYVSGKNIKVAVDACGEFLTATLKWRPFIIKPNFDELGEIFGERPNSVTEAMGYAKTLQEMGAKNVLVSMAGDGKVGTGENGYRLVKLRRQHDHSAGHKEYNE